MDPLRRRPPGRPRDLGIRARIVRAAQALFARSGFDGVHMDEIGHAADTSKTTVYLHFHSKQALFNAALEDLLAQLPVAGDLASEVSDGPIDEELLAIARQVNHLFSSASFALIRRALASDIPTRLRDRIWETAGLPYFQAIDDYLFVQARRGMLATQDSRAAASLFLALIAGGDAFRWQWAGAFSGLAEDEYLREAVQMFVRRHATAPTLEMQTA